MQVLYERCCGLDVHKKTVVACVLITLLNGQVQKLVRTFATTTAGLLALADWLASLQVSRVAMESTGIFWRPVSHGMRNELYLSSRTGVSASCMAHRFASGRERLSSRQADEKLS